MSLISTMEIGPVSTTPYNYTATVTSTANPKGFRAANFNGVITVAQAVTLSELVANPAARQTIGGETGVLEYVTSTSPVMGNFDGYYLLQSFNFVPDMIGENARFAGFSLSGVLIGDTA